MAKPKPYDELLSEIALAIEAGDKKDELAWKAELQSNYAVSEKQLKQEIKSLIKFQFKIILLKTTFKDFLNIS